MHRFIRLGAVLACALLCAAAGIAHAQAYPTHPIRLIVPFPPGGGSDAVGRVIAQSLTAQLGQQVIVDNRGGAGGSIGTGVVARSDPDGYTAVLASTSEIAINPALYPDLGYSTIKDLTPVAMVATTPMVVVANPTLPVSTMRDVIALARAKPGKINVASAGTGTITHLSGEMFRAMNKLNWTHVPYKGTAPALTDLVSGQVQLMFVPPPAVLGLVKVGRVKLLAVSAGTRVSSLPDIPTIAESGTPDYTVENWYGVFVPHGTPDAIVHKLSDEIARSLKRPDVIQALAAQGAEPATQTPAQFTGYVKTEVAKWGGVVVSSGAKAN
jgi:tripartite-type tricarboxylate transporter receptor subunit TctC